MCDFTDFIDSIETDIDLEPTSKDIRESYPCQPCGGTGKVAKTYGYTLATMRTYENTCKACKGKGSFKTSPYDRQKAKASRVKREENKKLDNLKEFNERFKENKVAATIVGLSCCNNNFCDSIISQVEKRGVDSLSDKQVAAIYKVADDYKKRVAEKKKAQQPDQTFRFAELARMFLTSSQKLKYPKLRLVTDSGQKVVLSRCGAQSKNAGHINVTDGRPYGCNTYFGRISPEGDFFPRKETPDEVKELLKEFDSNPKDAIKLQGIKTSNCCFCAKELTKEISIKRGCGDRCAERWGVEYDES